MPTARCEAPRGTEHPSKASCTRKSRRPPRPRVPMPRPARAGRIPGAAEELGAHRASWTRVTGYRGAANPTPRSTSLAVRPTSDPAATSASTAASAIAWAMWIATTRCGVMRRVWTASISTKPTACATTEGSMTGTPRTAPATAASAGSRDLNCSGASLRTERIHASSARPSTRPSVRSAIGRLSNEG